MPKFLQLAYSISEVIWSKPETIREKQLDKLSKCCTVFMNELKGYLISIEIEARSG